MCAIVLRPLVTIGVVNVAACNVPAMDRFRVLDLEWTQMWDTIMLCIDVTIHVRNALCFLNVVIPCSQVLRLHKLFEAAAIGGALIRQEPAVRLVVCTIRL